MNGLFNGCCRREFHDFRLHHLLADELFKVDYLSRILSCLNQVLAAVQMKEDWNTVIELFIMRLLRRRGTVQVKQIVCQTREFWGIIKGAKQLPVI
jgi:predicted acetyltransferase